MARNVLGLGFSFSAIDRGLGKFVSNMGEGFDAAWDSMDALSRRSSAAEKVIRGSAATIRFMGDNARDMGAQTLAAFGKVQEAAKKAGKSLMDYARGAEIDPMLASIGDRALLLREYAKAAGKELPKGAEMYAQSLLGAGVAVMDLADKIATEFPAAAAAAGKSFDDYVMEALKGASGQIQRGAPLMEVMDTLGKGLPEAAKESQDASEELGKEGSRAFGLLTKSVLKLNKMGLDKLKGAVSGLSMAFMGAASTGKEFITGLGKAGINKVGNQIRSLAGDLSQLPGQLTSGINLTTGYEAQMAALGKGAKKAAAQMGLTGAEAKKFAGRAAGMAYSLDISEESAMKALRAFDAYGEQLKEIGIMSAEDLAKYSEVFGIEADVIGRQTHQMSKALGFTNEEIKGLMSSAHAAGEAMWDIPGSMQMMDQLLPVLETQMVVLGKTKEETQAFGREVFAAAGAFYQLTNNAEEARQHAMTLTSMISDTNVEWEKMLGGMGDVPGLMDAATQAGVDANSVFGMMQEGPAGFMKAMSQLRFHELEEGSELLTFIRLKLTDALGGDVDMANQFLSLTSKMSKEGGAAIDEVMKGIMNANKDMGKAAREGFSTGRTLQEQWERTVDSFVAGFRKHGRPAAREFVKESGKEFKKFNKQLSDIVDEGGPLGQLVTKFSEVHQLGVLAMLPEQLRPAAAAFGTMFENMTPVLSSLQMMGIRVADLATPTAALTAGVGALVFAYVSAREESEKTVESLANSDRAMRKNDQAIQSLQKQLAKAEEGSKEFDAIQRRIDKRMSEGNLAKSMKKNNEIIAENQRLLKKRGISEERAAKAQKAIEGAEKELAATRNSIQDRADERTREGIKRMFTGAVDMVKLVATELPSLLRSVWPEISTVLKDLGGMVLSGLKHVLDKSLAEGGFVGMLIDKVINTLKDLGSGIGNELEAVFDPDKEATTMIGKIMEGVFKVITDLGPKLLYALLNAFAYIDFGKLAGQIATIVVKVVTFAVETIVKYAPSIISGLLDALSEAFPVLVEGLRQLIPLVPKILSELGLLLSDFIRTMLPGVIADLASLAGTFVGEILPVLADTLVLLLNTLAKQLPAIITSLIDVAGPAFAQFIGALLQIATQALPEIVQLIATELPKLVMFIADMFVVELQGLAAVITEIDWAGMLSKLLGSLLGIVQELLSGDFLSTIVATLISLVPPLAKGLFQFLVEATKMLASMDWNAMMDGILAALTTLTDMLPEILKPLLKGLVQALPDILLNLLNAGLKLGAVGMKMMIELTSSLMFALLESLPTVIGAMAQMFYYEIPKMFLKLGYMLVTDTIPNAILPVARAFRQTIADFFSETIPNILSNALEAIKTFFIQPFIDIVDWLIGNSIIVDMFQAGVDRITGIFTGLGESVSVLFSEIGGFLLDVVTGYFDLLIGFWEGVFWGIVDTAMWAGEQLLAFITDPITWIEETWAALPDIFWDVFEGVKGFVSDAIDSIIGWVEDAFDAVADAGGFVYDTFEYLFGNSVHTFIRDDLAQANEYTTQWADHTDMEAGRAFGGMTSRSGRFRDRAMKDAEEVKSAWAAAEGLLAEGKLGKALGGEGLGGLLKGLPGQATVLLGGKTAAEKEAARAEEEAKRQADIAKAAEDMARVQTDQERTLTTATLERLKVRKDAFDAAAKFEADAQDKLDILRRGAAVMDSKVLQDNIAKIEQDIARAYEEAGVSKMEVEFGRAKQYGQDLDRQMKQAQDTLLAIEKGDGAPKTPGIPGAPAMKPTPGGPRTMGALTAPRTAPVDVVINPPTPPISEMIGNDLATLDIIMMTWRNLAEGTMAITADNIAMSFEAMTDRIGVAFRDMWIELLNLTALATTAIAEDAAAAASDLEGIITDLRTAAGLRTKVSADEMAAAAPAAPLIAAGQDPLEVVAQTVNRPAWYHEHYEPLFLGLVSAVKDLAKGKSTVGGSRKTETKKRESSALAAAASLSTP